MTTLIPSRLRRLAQIAIAAPLLGALWAHGPIHQPAGYHDFADQRGWPGLPHAADVLSNLGFLIIGLYGWRHLAPRARQLGAAWPGYRLFLLGLMLTAAGSAAYHLAPDDARLVWDRLPIALACAGLLAGVRGDCTGRDSRHLAAALALAATLSVSWWHFSADLRPYLLLQFAPLLLVPLWQARYQAPRRERLAFGLALLCYLLAKLAELKDHAILDQLGTLSGHTLKHLLATLAAGLIVGQLVARSRGTKRHGAGPAAGLAHQQAAG